MQTAASVTAKLGPKLGLQSAAASRHSVALLHRAQRLTKAVTARPTLRHIAMMSYAQAYPEPAPAPRSNRVYTNYSVGRISLSQRTQKSLDRYITRFAASIFCRYTKVQLL